MNKYRLVITVEKRSGADRIQTTCTYVTMADSIADALDRAGRYAFFQKAEEGADDIKHISVTRIGEAEEDD